jgi:hypothetical protein
MKRSVIASRMTALVSSHSRSRSEFKMRCMMMPATRETSSSKSSCLRFTSALGMRP